MALMAKYEDTQSNCLYMLLQSNLATAEKISKWKLEAVKRLKLLRGVRILRP